MNILLGILCFCVSLILILLQIYIIIDKGDDEQ